LDIQGRVLRQDALVAQTLGDGHRGIVLRTRAERSCGGGARHLRSGSVCKCAPARRHTRRGFPSE
jgi:hypothetical protein